MENGMGTELVAPQASSKAKDFTWDLSQFAACVLPHLDSGHARSCELVRWIKRRRKKLVIEIEVADRHEKGNPPLRYIVKMNRRHGTRDCYETLSRLWEAGFRPPSPYTVPRPIAYISDEGLLVEEKAPGALLKDILRREADDATDAMVRAAGWLAALHTSVVDAPQRPATLMSAGTNDTRAALVGSLGSVACCLIQRSPRYGRELAETLPAQASRITCLAASALEQLESPDQSLSVPSHGDFHPRNIFIAPTGQVTAIDFHTFGRQEAAADVAYLLAQTAILGYFELGSFAATSKARDCFLGAYEDAVSPLPCSRLALYLSMAFLQSLHGELCIAQNDQGGIIEPWLDIAERCLLRGEVMLT